MDTYLGIAYICVGAIATYFILDGIRAVVKVLPFIWCQLFHNRYRRRTGDRRIRESMIAYDLLCEKCGIEDTEIQRIDF